MARLTFEWHFAQTPSPPKKTSRRPTCKTRRGQMRMPNAVLLVGVELSISTASVQQHRLIKERLRCQHVQLKVVETTMGRKSSENERERRLPKGAMRWAGSTFCQKSDRGPTVTWTRRRRVSGSSWKTTALRDRPASSKNKTKEALCSRLQWLEWVLLNNSNFCSRWSAKSSSFSGIERFS